MNAYPREAAVVTVAVCLALGLGACGQAGESGSSTSGKGALRIGLLLPENQTARYEQFDRPLIVKKVKELCGSCTVEYANARNDVATQQQQADSMITQGVDVLILDSVDSKSLRSAVTKAEGADIPVVAYDRGVEGPVRAFVSYDIKAIGRAQGEALLEALGDKADSDLIVRVEGPTTGEATPFEKGGLPVLKGKAKISKAYHAATWNPENAYAAMSGAIAAEGADRIDGVWAANDAVAGAVIAALKDARIRPLPPVVGQDADLAAVQRIVSGEQSMTVYKPYKLEADAAAKVAVALGRGEKLGSVAKDRVNSPTTKDIPAVLLTPISLTVDNIKGTVVKDGMYKIDQICTPKLRPACDRAGLTG